MKEFGCIMSTTAGQELGAAAPITGPWDQPVGVPESASFS